MLGKAGRFLGAIYQLLAQRAEFSFSNVFPPFSEETVQRYKMDSRVKVVHNDLISAGKKLIQESDVIVLNNVFDWFMPEEAQKAVWRFLAATIKVGAWVVAVPSLEESLGKLQVRV